MADPNELLQKYIELNIKQKQFDADAKLKRRVAEIDREAKKYKAQSEVVQKMMEIQGNADKERLGIYVDLVTQLNRFDELNPVDRYIQDGTYEYETTDKDGRKVKKKFPKLFYLDKDGEPAGQIPHSVAINLKDKEKKRVLTRDEIASGLKKVDPFGNVKKVQSANDSGYADAQRVKTTKDGTITIDGKSLFKIQEDINLNPTIDLPGEEDSAPKPMTSQPSQLSTVSDLIARNRKRGKVGDPNKPLKNNMSNAGGFNAGSSPNQFMGKRKPDYLMPQD